MEKSANCKSKNKKPAAKSKTTKKKKSDGESILKYLSMHIITLNK